MWHKYKKDMREYIDFSSKMLEIWSDCYDEIEKIFKENVKENGEVRICLTDFNSEYYGVRMADSYEDCFEFITSIGCKVEGDNVNITLYFNEDEEMYRRTSFDCDLEECDDTEALIGVYEAVHNYFEYESEE